MRTAVIAGAAAIPLLVKAAAMLVPAAHGVTRFIDDAYYYLIIARNFAQSGIPSFDGLHPTNGFHPLWMLLLAAMYRVIGAGADLFTQVLAAKALEAIVLALAVGTCLFAFHRLREKTPAAWGFLGAALVLFVPTFFLWEQGMESTLAALFLVVSLYAVLDGKPRWLAASLPLLFLARLDALVFVIVPIVWFARGRGISPKPLIPLTLAVAAYLAINLILTGHATPISGQIKSSFPVPTPHLEFLWTPVLMAPLAGWGSLVSAPNVFAASVLTALLAIPAFLHRGEAWARAVALALAIAALLIANILFFQRWDKGVEPRYLALPYLLLGFAAFAILAGMLAARASRFASLAPALVFVTLALGCAAVLGLRLAADRGQQIDRRTHFEVMSKVAPGERLAGTDVGGFAFWLERAFVNLDGVVNNRELQDAIRDGRLADYLERSGVRYLEVAFWDAPQAHSRTDRMYLSRIFPAGVAGRDYGHYDFSVYSYVHDAHSEKIRLCPADEIFREAIGRDGTANAVIVIYRLPRPVTAAAGEAKERRCGAQPKPS